MRRECLRGVHYQRISQLCRARGVVGGTRLKTPLMPEGRRRVSLTFPKASLFNIDVPPYSSMLLKHSSSVSYTIRISMPRESRLDLPVLPCLVPEETCGSGVE